MIERTFKVGDEVIGFEAKTVNRFKTERVEHLGTVIAVNDCWVFIDTMFGPVPFHESVVEFADAPF